MTLVLNLLYNLGFLVAITLISGFISRSRLLSKQIDLSQGLLFGLAACIGMLNSVELSPGLFFDGRSVMLACAGLFFGPTAAFFCYGSCLNPSMVPRGPWGMGWTFSNFKLSSSWHYIPHLLHKKPKKQSF